MSEENEQHACLSPGLSLEVRLAMLAVAQAKDIGAVRREMNLRFDTSDKALTAAFDSQESALQLQAAANAKHFGELNGEAGRLKSMQESYLPRGEAALTFGKLEDQVSDLKTAKDINSGRQNIISVIISTLIGLAFLALNIYFSKRP